MRREGTSVYAEPEDAATLRQIADEFGLTVEQASEAIELGPDHRSDELLRPRVAVLYRLVLGSCG